MGWDCTHHLVDPERIRSVLVPRLLGRAGERTAFDDREDAAEIWAKVRDALDGDGERAASMLCQLAVIWSAEELPHRYLRGVAFSLWDRLEGTNPHDGPPSDSPESLFAEMVEAYPALRGRFPTMFSGNYDTGVYVSPERVGEVRDWLRRQMETLPPDSAGELESVERVLTVAQERGLGYWEATDLAVSQTNADWLKLPTAPDMTEIPLPAVPRTPAVRGGRAWIGLMRGGGMVVDLATGRMERLTMCPRAVVQRPDGSAIGHVNTRSGRWVAATLDESYREIPLPDREWSLGKLVQVGDEIYGWPARLEEFPLLQLTEEGWQAVDGFAPGRRGKVDRGAYRTLCAGGADVLVWNGVIHQRANGSWYELPVTVEDWNGGPPPDAPVRTGDGALWLRSGLGLRRVHGDRSHQALDDMITLSTFAPAGDSDLVCTFRGTDDFVALVSPDGQTRPLSRKDLGLAKNAYHDGAFVHDGTVWLLTVQNIAEGAILRVPLDRLRSAEPRTVK